MQSNGADDHPISNQLDDPEPVSITIAAISALIAATSLVINLDGRNARIRQERNDRAEAMREVFHGLHDMSGSVRKVRTAIGNLMRLTQRRGQEYAELDVPMYRGRRKLSLYPEEVDEFNRTLGTITKAIRDLNKSALSLLTGFDKIGYRGDAVSEFLEHRTALAKLLDVDNVRLEEAMSRCRDIADAMIDTMARIEREIAVNG